MIYNPASLWGEKIPIKQINTDKTIKANPKKYNAWLKVY